MAESSPGPGSEDARAASPSRLAEAEQECRTSIVAINPGLALAHYHLSRVLIVQGRLYEAQREIGHIAEYAPNSWMVHLGGFWIGMASNRSAATGASPSSACRRDRS